MLALGAGIGIGASLLEITHIHMDIFVYDLLLGQLVSGSAGCIHPERLVGEDLEIFVVGVQATPVQSIDILFIVVDIVEPDLLFVGYTGWLSRVLRWA